MDKSIYLIWIYFLSVIFFTKQVKEYLPFIIITILLILLEAVNYFFPLETDFLLIVETVLIILAFILKNNFTNKKFKYLLILILLILASSKFIGKTFLAQSIRDEEFIKILLIFLIFKNFKDFRDFLLWISSLTILFLSTFTNIYLFITVLSLTITIYYTKEIIENLYHNLELDKLRYRKLLDRAISFEIQEGLNKVNDELKITHKKLKEIFKLSNRAIRPIDLEEIGENVISGLLNLGYKGVAILIEDKIEVIFKKDGFIPEIEKYKSIDLQNFQTAKILLNSKVVIIPLKKDSKTIGAIFVYKKSEILPDEIEYLQTYTNSVSTAIAKTLYFKEKEELERNLFQAEKHAVLGKLSAGISHNLKNPLAVITSSAFALRRKLEKGDIEKGLKLIDRIEKNSKRAEEIINKLLDYVKPSFYSKQEINLREVVENSIDFIKSSIKGKDIDIRKELEDITIKGDKNFIEQAIVNILLNSVEAIEKKGRIDVSLKRKNDYILLKIKDDGYGIPEDIKEHIFEPYFTTKANGTGLGLPIAKKIISEHSGEIEVKTEEGKGTEFIIKWKFGNRQN
ncbi:MAG: hypothetical protein DSY60_04615 [Persephonella sp.]|nr:MAG: hypothetical protein DSY60_04615 [Persephonella sp.]